ncbi:uncharacterized protein C9orf85 homolog isoform X2 [Amblyraja radiata]|uniref:uncharacterized protein C9orf85 homolog isoform X2 n=1 Tax=Amblyraja radiata TaxID=386614 RepID=UPI001404116D|nr:uncharacterized protein C9orf85 homolog isoform X2 [Amblyraja radiata]
MSSERGNVSRKRAQKHQNCIAFKNDKYDKTNKIKRLNAIVLEGVCKRCKEVLEWKIKYSKYKPLSQARRWLTSSETQTKQDEAETNPGTRGCVKGSEDDEDGDADSTDDSDLNGDDGSDVNDEAKSNESSTHLNTHENDTALQKSKPLKSKLIATQGELNISSLNLED